MASSNKGALIASALAVLIVIAGVVVWKSFNGGPADNRAQKTIAPGTYDFKQEIEKMQVRDKAKTEAEKPMGGF